MPNLTSFNNVGMCARERCGEWQMALYLLSQMRVSTVVPDEISFKAGIHPCGRAGFFLGLSFFAQLCSLLWPSPASVVRARAGGQRMDRNVSKTQSHRDLLDLHGH